MLIRVEFSSATTSTLRKNRAPPRPMNVHLDSVSLRTIAQRIGLPTVSFGGCGCASFVVVKLFVLIFNKYLNVFDKLFTFIRMCAQRSRLCRAPQSVAFVCVKKRLCVCVKRLCVHDCCGVSLNLMSKYFQLSCFLFKIFAITHFQSLTHFVQSAWMATAALVKSVLTVALGRLHGVGLLLLAAVLPGSDSVCFWLRIRKAQPKRKSSFTLSRLC